jgi:DNA-binding GntR family transcriptional regulator
LALDEGAQVTAGGTQLERLDPVPLLHHRVHEQLEALIVSRALPQGARIVESELAEQMGVSRGPVREALQRLARDGFVDLRPRQGAFVHVPTEKEVADFFDVRRGLELTSVALAAQRITAEQATHLRALLKRGNEMLEHGSDPSAYRERVQIHAEIARIADNPLLEQMLANIRRRADWYSPPFDLAMRRDSWHEHESIVEAIIDHDVERAQELMSKHIDGSRDHFYASLAPEPTAPTA